MVNKKIIFLLSSLLVLDSCIYAGEGDKGNNENPAKKQNTSDSPNESDEQKYSEYLWEWLINVEDSSSSFPEACHRLIKKGANPNFMITDKGIELAQLECCAGNISMLSYALFSTQPLCVLRALIEGGADLDEFRTNNLLVRDFIEVAGGKTDEHAVWVLKKLLSIGIIVEDDFLSIFFRDRPDLYDDKPEARREFVDILLKANPLCANALALNAQLTEWVHPGERKEGYSRHDEDNFCYDHLEADCAALDMTRRAGNLSLDCLSADAEKWSLEAVKNYVEFSAKDENEDLTSELRRPNRAPFPCSALITVLAARLFGCNSNNGFCKSNKVVFGSSEIIERFRNASKTCRYTNPNLALLNESLSPLLFPNEYKLNLQKLLKLQKLNYPMMCEYNRLSDLVYLSSDFSFKTIAGEMQLVSRSPHKISDAMRRFIQEIMAGKTEAAYNCMPEPEVLGHGFNLDNSIELLQLQCMNPQLSPTKAARLLFAFGRWFNLEKARSDSRAIGRSAVANHDRLLLPAQVGSSAAHHFGIGGSSFAQAGGGAAASSVSPKAVLRLKNNPEKLDK
jgi:hypothetical protein